MIFDKKEKTCNGKRTASSTNGACRRMQIDPYLSCYTKLKSKWIKGLNVKLDTLNLTKQRMGNSLELIHTSDNFLNSTPTVQALRSTINKWELPVSLEVKGYYQ